MRKQYSDVKQANAKRVSIESAQLL